ncbi:MAG: hypothetical protein GX613_14195 [Chloroflexi bacterium]|nr:hypothetical protein [Chloroflexota bacterium]
MMLLNLKTIHEPQTLDEALQRLAEPGVYPLYGGVALQRSSNQAVEAVIKLDRLGLDRVEESDDALTFGSMLSLEQVRTACLEYADNATTLRALAETIRADQPETLRHTMALGDLLVERDPQSLTLALLLALGATIRRVDKAMHLTVSSWLSAEEDLARCLIADISVPFGAAQAGVGIEKVARTPADAPIVAAVAYIELSEDDRPAYSALALVGVAERAIRQKEAERALEETGDVEQALSALAVDPPSDHWGSAEYRAEMARVTARRALMAAMAQARTA